MTLIAGGCMRYARRRPRGRAWTGAVAPNSDKGTKMQLRQVKVLYCGAGHSLTSRGRSAQVKDSNIIFTSRLWWCWTAGGVVGGGIGNWYNTCSRLRSYLPLLHCFNRSYQINEDSQPHPPWPQFFEDASNRREPISRPRRSVQDGYCPRKKRPLRTKTAGPTSTPM